LKTPEQKLPQHIASSAGSIDFNLISTPISQKNLSVLFNKIDNLDKFVRTEMREMNDRLSRLENLVATNNDMDAFVAAGNNRTYLDIVEDPEAFFDIPELETQDDQPPQRQQSVNHNIELPQSNNHNLQPSQSNNHNLQLSQSNNHNLQLSQSKNHNLQPPQSNNHNFQPPQSNNHNLQLPQSNNHNIQPPQSNYHNIQPPYHQPSQMITQNQMCSISDYKFKAAIEMGKKSIIKDFEHGVVMTSNIDGVQGYKKFNEQKIKIIFDIVLHQFGLHKDMRSLLKKEVGAKLKAYRKQMKKHQS